jgi:GntR family transcriptional repressor for pyruvate dehydrogenase complex
MLAEDDYVSNGESPVSGRVLPRATLADRVSDEMLADIYARNLKPGAVLPSEGDLALTYGVGRLVVREAVRTLVAREVLQSGQGRPARVREPSSRILTQLFEYHLRQRSLDDSHIVGTRRLLEGQIAFDAAERVGNGDGDASALFAAVESMRISSTSMSKFFEADDEFHQALGALANNPVVSLIMQGLNGLMNQTKQLSWAGNNAQTGSQDLTIAEHHAVAVAVGAADPVGARIAMEALVSRTLDNVRAAARA